MVRPKTLGEEKEDSEEEEEEIQVSCDWWTLDHYTRL